MLGLVCRGSGWVLGLVLACSAFGLVLRRLGCGLLFRLTACAFGVDFRRTATGFVFGFAFTDCCVGPDFRCDAWGLATACFDVADDFGRTFRWIPNVLARISHRISSAGPSKSAEVTDNRRDSSLDGSGG